MLYSKTNTRKNNINSYILLLSFLIEGNEEVKPLFVSLVKDTQDVVNKKKTFYSISNRSSIPLIAYLSVNFSDYFKKVNTEKLDSSNFNQLKNYLKKASLAF